MDPDSVKQKFIFYLFCHALKSMMLLVNFIGIYHLVIINVFIIRVSIMA